MQKDCHHRVDNVQKELALAQVHCSSHVAAPLFMSGRLLPVADLSHSAFCPMCVPLLLESWHKIQKERLACLNDVRSIIEIASLGQRVLAEKEEELRIAKKAAADTSALKADHSAAVSQLKEEHRSEMYLLQVKVVQNHSVPSLPPSRQHKAIVSHICTLLPLTQGQKLSMMSL